MARRCRTRAKPARAARCARRAARRRRGLARIDPEPPADGEGAGTRRGRPRADRPPGCPSSARGGCARARRRSDGAAGRVGSRKNATRSGPRSRIRADRESEQQPERRRRRRTFGTRSRLKRRCRRSRHASREYLLRLPEDALAPADRRAGQLGVAAEQLLLLLRRRLGTRTPTRTTRSPRPPRPSRPMPLPAQAHLRADRRPGGDRDLLRARRASGPRPRRRARASETAARAGRRRRRPRARRPRPSATVEDDVEIAGRAAVGARVALAGEAKARARLDAGRDPDRQLLLGAAAGPRPRSPAGFFDAPSLALAVRRRGASSSGIPARRAAARAPPQDGAGPRPRARRRARFPRTISQRSRREIAMGAWTPKAASRNEISIRYTRSLPAIGPGVRRRTAARGEPEESRRRAPTDRRNPTASKPGTRSRLPRRAAAWPNGRSGPASRDPRGRRRPRDASLNFSAASGLFGLRSGWYMSASLRYADFSAAIVGVAFDRRGSRSSRAWTHGRCI